MNSQIVSTYDRKMTSIFERYLTVWVGLCIVIGILAGKIAPDLAKNLDGMAMYVNGAPVVSLPIAACLFFMMYPIMVKIDFAGVVQAGKSGKPVLLTLILLFSFKGETILANPLTILWISIPLFLQTILIFALGYGAARVFKLKCEDADPAAMIGASNHFEVAIATVVGVLTEVPVMLMLVGFCKRTASWFE